MTTMIRYFPNLELLAFLAGTLLVTGCVVGDGEGAPWIYPESGCRAFPDEPDRCGQPWSGQIIQSCAEGVSTTSLRYDRPEVPDSLRLNVIVFGNRGFFDIRWNELFRDTAVVCDSGLCRKFIVGFRASSPFPIRGGMGHIEFFDLDSPDHEMRGSVAAGPITLKAATSPIEYSYGGIMTLDTTILGTCE